MLSCTQEFAHNNHSLNFIGTFIDLADLGIAHVPLSGVFLAVAVAAAEDLDAFDGVHLGHGRLFLIVQMVIFHLGGPEEHQLRRIQLRRHVGQFELNGLEG